MSVLKDSPLVSGPEIFLQRLETKSSPLSCLVLGIAHGQMHLRSDQPIEPLERVLAVFSRITLSSEVVYCTKKDDWYRICVTMIGGNEHRHGPRLLIREPTTINALAGEGSESTEGMLLDVSVSGMRLEMPRHIQTGTMLFVETESTIVVGEVRHCHEGRNGRFEAGVAVTDVLSSAEARDNSRGILKNIRRRLAQVILGEPIIFTRRLT